jgi:hypothetical protein
MATTQSSSPFHSPQATHSPETLFSEAARSWLDLRDSPSVRVDPRSVRPGLVVFPGGAR